MAQAMWNGVVLADSDRCEVVEGNLYFPAESLNMDYFQSSTHQTTCGWKGVASYYTIVVNGQTNANAAWYYADPKPAAANIKGRVAFWKGVQVKS
jgi:uncharacterized protein (DUF427 family)